MAKKKPPDQRSPKNKERKGAGFRTLGIRMSDEYMNWLSLLAKRNRMTAAAVIDKALVELAAAQKFEAPPPERLP